MPSLWAASLFWSGDTVITPPPGPSTPGYAGWQAGPLLAWTLLLSLLPGALPVGLLLLPEVVPYRRRGLARPQGPFVMNRDSPQSAKLAGWWPMTGWSGLRGMGLQPIDAVPQAALPRTTLPDAGIVTDFNGSAWANTGVIPYSASGNSPFSMSFWYRSLQNLGANTSSTPWATTELGTQNDATHDKQFAVIPVTGHVRFFAYDSTTSQTRTIEGVNNVNDGVAHLITGTYSGGALVLFVDGVLQGTYTICASTYTFTSAQFVWNLLYASSGTPASLVAQMWDCRYYTRCLSLQSIQEVWALYDPATRNELYWVPSLRSYGFLAGAGTTTPATPAQARYMPLTGAA